MDSSDLLIRAASGLEKTMAGSQPGIFQDSTVAQISAFVYYQANVIAKLTTSKSFANKFQKTIFDQINKDFGEYIDAQARIKPKSLHHVYEWNMVGNSNARLFKLQKVTSNDLSFQITSKFLPSKTFANSSGNRRHVFKNKAMIMEAGMPLKISPRFAERLVFELNGEKVFMPKGASVVVKSPGGKAARNQYMLNHSIFFKSQLVNESIKKSGFQRLFTKSMTRALKIPVDIRRVKYKFSPNTVKSQAEYALALEFGEL